LYSKQKNQGIFFRFSFLCILVSPLLFMGCTGSESPLFVRPPGIVDGTIVGLDNGPIHQASVRLENKLQSSSSVLTNNSGNFSIPAVAPGTYDLVAEKTITGVKFRARRRFLRVAEESLISRDIQIRPVGTIRGSIILEGQSTHEGIEVSVIGTGRTLTTQADGSYEFRDLAYTYRDDASNQVFLYNLTLKKDGFEMQTIKDTSLEAGGLTVLNSVTLQNLDPSGVADVTGQVALEARDGAFETEIKILGTAIPSVVIQSDGSDQRNFDFKELPTGTYILQVSHPDYNSTQTSFTIEAGQGQKDLGTLILSNVKHYGEDRKAIELTLSPAGNQIAYGSYAPGKALNHREVFIMDIDGQVYNTRISSRAAVAEDRGMSWSSDGAHLLYVEKNETAISRLYRLNHISSSGGEITGLTPFSLDIAQPAFGPQELGLVYQRFENSGSIFGATLKSKVTGFALEGEFEVIPERNDQISQNQFSSMEFGFSDRILYTKDREGGFTIPLNAGGDLNLRFPVLNMGAETHSVTFSPSNNRIAYANSEGATPGIYMANVDGSLPERIAIAYGRSLEITPDGKTIVFIDQRPNWSRRLARIKIPRHWQ
jgi:Tol biopolymer transport system component